MSLSLLAETTEPVWDAPEWYPVLFDLSLIHISEPTRRS